MQVTYLCDRKQKCKEHCLNDDNYPCRHTLDPEHALNGICKDPQRHPERFWHMTADEVDIYEEKEDYKNE